MTTRSELVNALRERFSLCGVLRQIKQLEEFVAVSGYHRKHDPGAAREGHHRERGRAPAIVSAMKCFAITRSRWWSWR